MTETETDLLRLVAQGRFSDFDKTLGEYLAGLNTSNPEIIRSLLVLLNAAVQAARTRRAHYELEVTELQQARVFLGPQISESTSLSFG